MKILIVKIGAIGDLLMSRSMLAHVPAGSEVSWLCGKSVSPLVRRFSGVSEVIAVDDAALLSGSKPAQLWALASSWRRLAGRRFDLIATGHSDRRYHLLSLGAFSPLRRSFAAGRLVPGRFHGDEYARLIHGIDGPAAPKTVYKNLEGPKTGALGGGRWALLFPGGAKNLLRDDALRRWPLEHYAALAGLLRQKGWKVAYSGSASDAWVRPAMAASGALDLVGRFNLEETLGLCSEAELVVTHDSGPLHLAAASGTRVLGLFGPTNPIEKIADGYAQAQAIWGGEELACRPCYDGRDYAPCSDNVCLGRVLPGRVCDAIEAGRAG